MNQAVILLSGGLDSSTLLHYVRKTLGCRTLHALTFRYGQKHAREIECAQWQAHALAVAEHQVLDLTVLGNLSAGVSALTDACLPVPDMAALRSDQRDQPPTYVPNRNMILLALAAAYAESKGITDVFYGAQIQDRYGYWDCTPEFLDRMNAVLVLNRRGAVRIHAPFIRMSKQEIVRIGQDLGVDYGRTWTCYRGMAKACGACPSCVERLGAFRRLDVSDPLDYETI
ncbi:MAG: 7-cyano-7-deazaguanine synthase QueC [Verrucomicrobia bacterium]|nr:7-cyano-7-deazaguanine synthase QueC [Verrucomicrobiota bacterium]MCG2680172.1 7-cyano-7-deazaguanine synthase QueC [Kiritimatiellia bacterium]MBU4247491.1 7-cyano-7-deazaguanine synthase QueC [Verrucomicrobiota bacterium]MBU4289460.1 7-cyano-7-deazaguanine synthase QueC [Verrucomicrobiota bacterium]MBU4429625.1 7-cyano-7-deazaguanine synthase QueC [Verrucomicrobiota bacterium]